MIQRIQSVWLLLAAACAFAGLKLSFYSGTKLADPLLKELNGTETILLMITGIAVGGLALITIFLFKNRALQFKLCLLGILLQLVLIYLYYREVTGYTQGTYSLTSILQPTIVLSFILAAVGIRKDSKMVKNSDRLR